MAKVHNAVEILPKIWTAWVGWTNVTDRRQTDDRQTTDGRAIAYSEREREFTFAKNCHQQSCSAINCLSSGINILAGGSSVPLTSERW